MRYNLYENVFDWNTLKRSYKQTQTCGRKYRIENILFDMAREKHLVDLWRELKDKTYEVGKYIRFKVFEPKERIVSAPHIKDKIVQFAAHLQLFDVYKRVFIKDTYGCIQGRGTHDAVRQVQHFMRQCQWENGTCWVLKMDVRKFFYSIDREILKTLYRKKIGDPDFLRLLDMIVDSSPEGERGIPLGNVTSQDFANIYLNEVDQFAKRFLGVKYYVRYMDDIIVCVPTKEEARNLLARFREFVETRLHLELNQKTDIFPVKQGVNAYGFRIYTTHLLVRDDSKKAMKRRIKAMDRKLKLCRTKEQRKTYLKAVTQSVNSWLGHSRHSNSFNLAKKIFSPYDYVQVDDGLHRFGKR
jgi:retron-type reverse transcriptase